MLSIVMLKAYSTANYQSNSNFVAVKSRPNFKKSPTVVYYCHRYDRRDYNRSQRLSNSRAFRWSYRTIFEVNCDETVAKPKIHKWKVWGNNRIWFGLRPFAGARFSWQLSAKIKYLFGFTTISFSQVNELP